MPLYRPVQQSLLNAINLRTVNSVYTTLNRQVELQRAASNEHRPEGLATPIRLQRLQESLNERHTPQIERQPQESFDDQEIHALPNRQQMPHENQINRTPINGPHEIRENIRVPHENHLEAEVSIIPIEPCEEGQQMHQRDNSEREIGIIPIGNRVPQEIDAVPTQPRRRRILAEPRPQVVTEPRPLVLAEPRGQARNRFDQTTVGVVPRKWQNYKPK